MKRSSQPNCGAQLMKSYNRPPYLFPEISVRLVKDVEISYSLYMESSESFGKVEEIDPDNIEVRTLHKNCFPTNVILQAEFR